MEEMGFCVHNIGLKRSPKVKYAMALYISWGMQGVMLLSKSAQFTQIP